MIGGWTSSRIPPDNSEGTRLWCHDTYQAKVTSHSIWQYESWQFFRCLLRKGLYGYTSLKQPLSFVWDLGASLTSPIFIILIPDLLMTATMLTNNTNFPPMILEILFAKSFIGETFWKFYQHHLDEVLIIVAKIMNIAKTSKLLITQLRITNIILPVGGIKFQE